MEQIIKLSIVPNAAPTPAPASASEPRIRKPVVIYADDDLASLRLLKELAREDGSFEVECVTSGEELLERFRSSGSEETVRYQAAIIDLNLGLNDPGSRIARRLREQDKRVPVAIFTNYDAEFVKKYAGGDVEIWYKSEMSLEGLTERVKDLIKSGNLRNKTIK